MHTIKFHPLKKLLVILSLIYSSCGGDDRVGKIDNAKWIIENENAIVEELDKIIWERISASVNETLWIKKSFVITEDDTTILGSFANRIKKINKCFDVMYTHSRKSEKIKKITIIRDLSGHCESVTNKPFSIIDSTKYLRISFDTLY